jgi:hypothetical protein
MKWLVNVVKGTRIPKKMRTPMPPKPYSEERKDGDSILKSYEHDEVLAGVDPERPHWKDPKFESRGAKVPFFDFFGYNRNWSWTLFKCFCCIGPFMALSEGNIMVTLGEETMNISTCSATSIPEYSRDEKATEKELRDAGFAYVGHSVVKAAYAEKSSIKSNITLAAEEAEKAKES